MITCGNSWQIASSWRFVEETILYYSLFKHELKCLAAFNVFYYQYQYSFINIRIQKLSDRLQVSGLEMLRNVSLAFGVSADCTGSLFCNIGTLRALFCLDHCPNTGPTVDNEGDDTCAVSVIHCCYIFSTFNPSSPFHSADFIIH